MNTQEKFTVYETIGQSDYDITGKLYPKLDSYAYFRNGKPAYSEYLGSSNQFRTQAAYKAWLMAQPEYQGLEIRVRKGEN